MIGYELSDPRVSSATVTGIEVSPDKRHALVRVGVDRRRDAPQAIAALEHAAHSCAAKSPVRLELFRVPELHFEADIATELGGRMEHLLKRIKKGRPRE
jgi:ribosome-binding factor A